MGAETKTTGVESGGRSAESSYVAFLGEHVIRCNAAPTDIPRLATDLLEKLGKDYEPQLFVHIEPDERTAPIENQHVPAELIPPIPVFERKSRRTIDLSQLGLPMQMVDARGVIHILGI